MPWSAVSVPFWKKFWGCCESLDATKNKEEAEQGMWQSQWRKFKLCSFERRVNVNDCGGPTTSHHLSCGDLHPVCWRTCREARHWGFISVERRDIKAKHLSQQSRHRETFCRINESLDGQKRLCLSWLCLCQERLSLPPIAASIVDSGGKRGSAVRATSTNSSHEPTKTCWQEPSQPRTEWAENEWLWTFEILISFPFFDFLTPPL